jgi:hypothetical protein
MPDSSSADFTGPQYGLIATLILGVGAALGRGITTMAKAWLTKDEALSKVHEDKFKIVIDEWRLDRETSVEQQKLNAEATRHNTEATCKLEASIKELAVAMGEIKHTLESRGKDS